MNETSPTGESSASESSSTDGHSIRERNIAALAAYIESGAKTTPGALGIELEHVIVREGGSPVPYSGSDGVQHVLEELRTDYPDATLDEEGDLLGVARSGEAVTIEPAAQVELSAGPFHELSAAKVCFERFEGTLDAALAPVHAKTAQVGYHPTARAMDMELIPKTRYACMNRYLGAVGPFGPCMMRGSASTQVSIDYTDAADCLRKYRIASALVPVLSLICDNSPVFEGAPRAHKLVRTKIWQECDPDRCGIVPGAMDPSFSFYDYARWVYDTPAILVPDGQGGWREDARPFSKIYAQHLMTRSEVEHALSMVFPDVRLKTYLEIRPADAMPVPYVIAYAALVKGIFYYEESLKGAERLVAGATEDDIAVAKEELMAHGYQAEVYGHPVSEIADALIELARTGLRVDEREYLKPLADLVAARETLADRAER
mgnify:CR=1 FL=1